MYAALALDFDTVGGAARVWREKVGKANQADHDNGTGGVNTMIALVEILAGISDG